MLISFSFLFTRKIESSLQDSHLIIWSLREIIGEIVQTKKEEKESIEQSVKQLSHNNRLGLTKRSR